MDQIVEEKGVSKTIDQPQHHERLGSPSARAALVGDDAMTNYGMSNESGKLLAQELLAREMQARELLAREMGSAVCGYGGGSLDHHYRSKRSHISRRSFSRTYDYLSNNMSVDGSIMSRRSRWEMEQRDPKAPHESSSLPAEFLYFKFEQIAARWTKHKETDVVSLERIRPPPYKKQSPPKTITTVSVIPEEKNIPRFMQNTSTSASKRSRTQHEPKVSSPTAFSKTSSQFQQHQRQDGRTRSPSKSHISEKRQCSLSPLRNTLSSKRNEKKLNLRDESSQSQSKTEMLPADGNKRFPGALSKKRSSSLQVDTRSPQDSTEPKNATHYSRREGSADKPQQEELSSDSKRRIHEHKLPPLPHFSSPFSPLHIIDKLDNQQQRPDPEGEIPRCTSPQLVEDALLSTARDTGRCPDHPETTESSANTPASAHDVPNELEKTRRGPSSPMRGTVASQARRESKSPISKTRATKNPPFKDLKKTPLKASPSFPDSPTGRRKKSRLPPLPSFRNATSPKSLQEENESFFHNSSPSKRRVATSELASAKAHARRKGSPFAPDAQRFTGANRNNSTRENDRKSSEKATTASSRLHTGVPTAQRKGTDPPSRFIPPRYGCKHVLAVLKLQRYTRMLYIRRSFLKAKHGVILLQCFLRRKFASKLAQRGTPIQHFSCTVIQRSYRMSSCQASYYQLRYAIIIIQSFVRMCLYRSSYLELRKASKKLLGRSNISGEHNLRHTPPQRRNEEKPARDSAVVRGGRLRIYSAILIQSLLRMHSVRTAFLELRTAAIVIQRWFRETLIVRQRRNIAAIVLQKYTRMNSWRSCFLDLRVSVILLQKWIRMFNDRTKYLVTKKAQLEEECAVLIQSVWRRNGCRDVYNAWKQLRLKEASALIIQSIYRKHVRAKMYLQLRQAQLEDACAGLIQSIYRRSACRAAFRQLRNYSIAIQHWVRARSIRLAFIKLCDATVVLQCWARQKISERIVLELICIRLIQSCIRGYLRRRMLESKRAFITVIQAAARGYQCKINYRSLQQAAVTTQKIFRGQKGRARCAIRRFDFTVAAKSSNQGVVTRGKELNKVISSRLPSLAVDTTIDTLVDSNKEEIDPAIRDPTDRKFSHRPPRYDNPVSAALAHISQTPCIPTKKVRDAQRPIVQQPSGATPKRSDLTTSSFPKSSIRNVAEPQSKTSENSDSPPPILVQPSGKTQRRSNTPRSHDEGESQPSAPLTPVQLEPPIHAKSTDIKEASPQLNFKGIISREPDGNNGSRRIAVDAEAAPCTPPPGGHALAAHKDHVKASVSPFILPHLPTGIVNDTPSDLTTISPGELTPSPQPLYMVSQSSDGPKGSSQVFTLQPLSELPPQQSQNPQIYYVSTSHLPTQQNPRFQFPIPQELDFTLQKESSKLDMKPSLLDEFRLSRLSKAKNGLPIKNDRFKDILDLPSIVENPSYYLPKAEVKNLGAKENQPELTEIENNEAKSSFDRHSSAATTTSTNPLKQVLLNRPSSDIPILKSKKEEEITEKAISQKLELIKRRSRARIVQRWTKRTLKRDKTTNVATKEPIEDESQQSVPPTPQKRALLDVAVEHWSRQTATKRKTSLLTSALEDDFATQIQSIWRSHRDQLLLAGLLLKTWAVSCDFMTDTLRRKRSLRQNAHVLALDGALGQIGYRWQNGRVLVKNGLIMVQWEVIVPILFSKYKIDAEDSSCKVNVHCTVKECRLLRAWSGNKRNSLLVKAAFAKHVKEKKTTLRDSSAFDIPLIRKREKFPQTSKYATPSSKRTSSYSLGTKDTSRNRKFPPVLKENKKANKSEFSFDRSPGLHYRPLDQNLTRQIASSSFGRSGASRNQGEDAVLQRIPTYDNSYHDIDLATELSSPQNPHYEWLQHDPKEMEMITPIYSQYQKDGSKAVQRDPKGSKFLFEEQVVEGNMSFTQERVNRFFGPKESLNTSSGNQGRIIKHWYVPQQQCAVLIQRAFRRYLTCREDTTSNEEESYSSLGVPGDFQLKMMVYSASLIQSWYRMCVCRSMYQGLKRMQSRILLRVDQNDVEAINFSSPFLQKHVCETIVEEDGGFECTTGSGSSDDS